MPSGHHTEWAAVDEARRTWHTFRRDWVAIPRERRKRFAVTLTVGWIASALLMLAMSYGLRALHSPHLEALERVWLERIIEVAPFDFGTAIFFESPGNGVVLISLSIVLSIVFARRGRPLWALGVLAACLMVAVVVGLGWMVWDRGRPDFIYQGLPSSGLSAFPSGHASMSIPTYGFLLYLGVRHSKSRVEKALAALCLIVLFAILVFSRFVLSAHWPTDVLGGAVLGTVWLAVVIVALQRGEEEVPSDPDSSPHSRRLTHAERPG